MRRINQEQLAELLLDKEKIIVILEHIGKATPFEIPSYHNQFLQVTMDTFENKDLRGMRHIFKDVKECAKALNRTQMEVLNKELKGKFDIEL